MISPVNLRLRLPLAAGIDWVFDERLSVKISMIKNIKAHLFTALLITGVSGCGSDNETWLPEINSKQLLGDALFHDSNLSKNGTQSCATCHSPENGFADVRDKDGQVTTQLANSQPYAASLGDDGVSLGDRNAPTAAYAALIPEFSKGTRNRIAQQQVTHGAYTGYLGGQFWDGRESNLTGQAGGPPTNPLEMGMADKAAVVTVLKKDPKYVEAFEYFYDSNIFDDVETAYAAMADAIAEFETKDEAQFLAFDSKYDKTLAFPVTYQYPSNSKAEIGEALFFSSDFACAACHQLNTARSRQETFTSFEYHNIGVPENTELKNARHALGIEGALNLDLGLANNANIAAEDVDSSKGKFKVPTLRNVAVTAPYMHNGIFNSLEAVLKFYEHAKLRSRGIDNTNVVSDIINSETQQLFREAEISGNIAHDLLGANQINLTPENIEALVCFFMALTDEKYEQLLDPQKVNACRL